MATEIQSKPLDVHALRQQLSSLSLRIVGMEQALAESSKEAWLEHTEMRDELCQLRAQRGVVKSALEEAEERERAAQPVTEQRAATPEAENCDTCDGTGKNVGGSDNWPRGMMFCRDCHGYGKQRAAQPVTEQRASEEIRDLPTVPGETTAVKDRMDEAVAREYAEILLQREIACAKAALAYPLPGHSGKIEAVWFRGKLAEATRRLVEVRGE